MTRLLITGTSHVAALKAAWDRMETRPKGVEIDFLAALAGVFPLFAMGEDGQFGLMDPGLVTADQLQLVRNFGGELVRDLGDYSHVLIAGCSLGGNGILKLLAGHRVDLIRETPADLPRLSQGAYVAFSQALAMKQYPAQLVQDFAPWAKLALAASPRPAEGIWHEPKAEPHLKTLAEDLTGLHQALALTDAALEKTIASQGHRFFAVPPQSLAASGFTKEAYARDGARIRSGKKADLAHMNADYGALCLQPILDWLAEG